MAKTSISGDTPYATPSDYLARVDCRLTGDLARDDGSEASPTDLLTDPNLATALADASGMLEASVLVSEMYSVADLQALTGNSLSLLKRIVCGLTVQGMRERRGLMEESTYPMYQNAVAMLEAIHQGRNIFAFAETASAGLPDISAIQSEEFFNLTPTLFTNRTRYWGTRSDRRGCGDF